jgi:hypothetical protein
MFSRDPLAWLRGTRAKGFMALLCKARVVTAGWREGDGYFCIAAPRFQFVFCGSQDVLGTGMGVAWMVLFFFLVEILEAQGRRLDETDTMYAPLRKALGLRATLS